MRRRRRRLPRILLNAATVASLLLCVAALILRTRSWTRTEGVGFRLADRRCVQVFSDRGRVCFDVLRADAQYPPGPGMITKFRLRVFRAWAWSVARPPGRQWPWGTAFDAPVAAALYHRFGFSAEPPDGHQVADSDQYRLIPANPLHANWEDDYYFLSRDTAPTYRPTYTLDLPGITILKGMRDVPVWVGAWDGTLGMLHQLPGQTVAVSHWLLAALFGAAPALRLGCVAWRRATRHR
jgi:hypothetical protein